MHLAKPKHPTMSRRTNRVGLAVRLVLLVATMALSSGCCLLFKAKSCSTGEGAACCAGGEYSPVRLNLPATYSGTLPCADCPGTEWTLQLWPDSVYYLRTGYLERGENGGTAEYDEIGQFEYSAALGEVVLRSGRDGRQRFALKDANTLRKLDAHGMEIESQLNYDLVKQAAAAPLEPQLLLVGMYSYMADAGRLRDCRTGREYPVAQEADNAELERSYTAARENPGAWLLVSLEGRLTTRSQAEGGGEQEVVVVEHFVKIWPGDTCGAHESVASLTNTFWALTWVDGSAVGEPKAEKEIHLMLEPHSGDARGFGGCNQFTGSYELDGRSLKFGALVSTQMYWAEYQQLEDRYFNALGRVASWKIFGELLELYDAKHELLAKFEARYFQ